MRYWHCVAKFQLQKLGCALTWHKNAVLQLRNCVVLQLNQKVHSGSCAVLQKLQKLICAYCAALLQVKRSLRFVAMGFCNNGSCATSAHSQF